MKAGTGGLVGGPHLVPGLGASLVGLGGQAGRRERAVWPASVHGPRRDERGTPGGGGGAGRRERAVWPASVHGPRRDERGTPGGVVGVVVAWHRDQPAGGVGQVGAEGRTGSAAAGPLHGAA